ncbi:hypothetical protein Bbelb_064770 [Branchiostoma belcheri]|nr:hypothetical protein Bbelb_064770 [Branchiostoma belcheri]
MIEDTAVEKVPEFVFLGSVVPGTTSDIKRRIALAASAFGRLRKTVWNRRDISKNLKVRLFQALILPIATYACETWTLKKSDELLLLSFEMRCLRVILCITLRDRIPNAEIRSRLGAEQTITDRIRTRRLRWFGHVMRRPTNTLVYKAYHQDFQNPRPRGRPPKRWKDQIQSDTGITLSVAEAIALDRTGENAPEPKTADIAETRAVADENDLDLRRVADDGLVRNGGCEGHQENSGAHLITTTVSAEDQTASAILLSVLLVLKLNLTPTASGHRFAATAFGVFTGIVGLVGFVMDRIESAQTTAQLNEIQDQIRELDGKIDGLTQRVSDLQLGQQYLQQVILHGRDELRLRNVLDTLASIRASNGQYVGSDLQGWADSVLSHGSDGIRNVAMGTTPGRNTPGVASAFVCTVW